MDPKLKLKLSDSVELLLRQNIVGNDTGIESVQVTRINNLTTQVKIWERNGAPRYFNVTVSEMM